MERIKHAVRVSVVNFRALWGNKQRNLERILDMIEAEAKAGASIIVFPEMALTGYDAESGKTKKEMMQYQLAETIPGPATQAMAEITKKYGVYTFVGMPERDRDNPDVIYNSAAICGPEGVIGGYRKIHVPLFETSWADRGENPMLVDTPWGKVGVSICYDTYVFPELAHYYRAKGARLMINCTAFAKDDPRLGKCRRELESVSFNSMIFVASANLTGKDLETMFVGGSSILGPSHDHMNSTYYAGYPFHTDITKYPVARETTSFSAMIDLTVTDDQYLNMFSTNEMYGEPDLRCDLYAKWFTDVMQDENWKAKFRKQKEVSGCSAV